MSDAAGPYRDAAGGLESLPACGCMPEGRSAVSGSRDPDRQMTNAAMRDSSVGDAPAPPQCQGVQTPDACKTIPGAPQGGRVQTLKRPGRIPGEGLTVATGMRLIPGYGKKPGAEPTISRHRKGTRMPWGMHDGAVC